MKFYVHYEDQPGYTVVYRASPGDRNATVWSLVCWFASKYNSTHTAEKSIDPKFLTVSSGIARRELEADSLLRKSLADHSDVFVSARQRPDTPLTGQTTYNDNSFRCVDEELPAAPNHGGVGADTRHAVGAGSATEARPPEAAEVAEASAMAERLLNAAERAEASKNLRHAVSILEQLLALLPQRARPALACLSRLSRLWLSAGRPREALLHARDAAARFPGEEAPQVLLGDCLSHAGARKAELSEALGCYEAALGRRGGPASGAPDLLLARARTLHRLSSGDPAAAAAAGSLVMEVLAADQQNWDGLLLYAQTPPVPTPPMPSDDWTAAARG
uniref:Uncharacterized protein n=1 Tax=Tetraselmis sp. GSL018 TaxID=582737 RepID=A0A061S617_9CHLO|mmetsp:Transcript_10059/g.23991  ORF Transcript_10059/g.23991 Transcript_10059/m.23991 type:complete len:333 (-) Transcript_10059:134-1132(-)|eukprot:CAMPEP_0177603176 /NCGR_PEP_ID=MMETSP0419_2-20121207/15347_1 /TAXON_ID=582737 /ORGANISM="Tetraselmis sp., Strain GSL018" /LENGTH=332 /DNA_ID=CAMNT_0019096879 /DNA_START=50 /DNA_END=1048 /DNA_ORIENTATION=-